MGRLQEQALKQVGAQATAATNPEVQKCLEEAEKAGEARADPVAQRAGEFSEALGVLRRGQARAVLVDISGVGRIVFANGQVGDEFKGRKVRINVVDDRVAYGPVLVSLDVALQRGLREGGLLWNDPPQPVTTPAPAEPRPERNKLRDALSAAAAAVRGESPVRQNPPASMAAPPEPVMVPPQTVARLPTAPATAPPMSAEATIFVDGQPVDLDNDVFRSAVAQEAYLKLKTLFKSTTPSEIAKAGLDYRKGITPFAVALGSFAYVYSSSRTLIEAPRNPSQAQMHQDIEPLFASLRVLSQPDRAEVLARTVRDIKAIDNSAENNALPSILGITGLTKQFPEIINIAVKYKARPRQGMGGYITHEMSGAELDYANPALVRRGSMREFLSEHTIIMNSMYTALGQNRQNLDQSLRMAVEMAAAQPKR